ncbi:chromosome segregation protein [compost metagenome]
MAKQIKLISLIFSHFKGLTEFTLAADGEDIDVYGPNAGGKTTLFDGFNFLLFHKDSLDRGNPEKWIKTLDVSGEPLHGIDHEITGVLEINGKRHSFRKVFSEKWTKKRGSATAEFTGHTTDYYIDDASFSQSDYKAEIAKIIDEDTFKLLTNPAYFAERLDADKRRSLLLEVCGDISDSDVINSNKSLGELPALLDNRSMEGHRDKLKKDQTRINSELKNIPIRISEVQRVMPDVSGSDGDAMLQQINTIRNQIQEKEAELTRIQSGGEISVKTNQFREVEGELLQIKNNLQATTLEKLSAKRSALSKKRGEVTDIEDLIRRTQEQIDRLRNQISQNEAERARLREERDKVKASSFAYDASDSCPTCGQPLPPEKVEDARNKAERQFNENKSRSLEQIVTRGKTEKSLADQWTDEVDRLTAKVEEKLAVLQALNHEVNELASEVGQMENDVPEVSADPAYTAKFREKEAIERAIRELRSQSISALDEARLGLAKLRSDLESEEKKYAGIDQAQKGMKRIEELKSEERELAKQYEELERQLYLTEEFTRTKVRMLESKINSKFKEVRFRLFETQVNGGLKETCKILYGPNLVPYEDGLNRAAQLNAGLDIINTLSEHYDIIAPIFIDNAEAVTDISNTSGQQIRLIVSRDDFQLRVNKKESIVQEELF